MNNTTQTGKRRIHVIVEFGPDYRPYSSSFLRLIRPLTHPQVQAHIDATFGLDYNNEPADLVIIDRLWRFDVSMTLVEDLVHRIRLRGSRIIYSLDDDYFDMAVYEHTRPVGEILPVVTYLLRHADAVLVTTPALRQRLLEFNPNIHILPNQLDERLLVTRFPAGKILRPDHNPTVIGYMGTFTHDADFKLVLPALKSIHQRYPGRIEVQVVGVINEEATKEQLQGLPVRYVYPTPAEHEYPLFLLWFTGQVRWDIAIAPLGDTPFNNCKSDIKFLDYASIGAAGVFSQSPAYSSTIRHRQNGWLAENTPAAWEEAMDSLINDPELRLNIARNAARNLYTQRTLSQHAFKWVELINRFSQL
jgi:processive 1,2-diacylglycerol beta-glucosyltransferase